MKKKDALILITIVSIIIILIGAVFLFFRKPIEGFSLFVIGGIIFSFKNEISNLFRR